MIVSTNISRYFGFIAGPSGVGKHYGVGQPLQEYYGARIFVTGDWCRDHQNGHAKEGSLAPDEPLIEAIVQDYEQHHQPEKFLIDAPRNITQVLRLIGLFKQWDPEAKIVTAHITAERHFCETRIRHRAKQQGRLDDAKDDVVNRRLDVYFKQGGISETVIPVLKQHTQYELIDGNSTLETIREMVREQHGPALFNA
jgi:adenylate kinase family enzyme